MFAEASGRSRGSAVTTRTASITVTPLASHRAARRGDGHGEGAMRVGRRWRTLLLLVGLVVVAMGVGLAAGTGRPGAPAARRSRPRAGPATAGPGSSHRREAGTRGAPVARTPATTTTTPPTQTTVLPSATNAQFRREMADLFQGIRLDAPALAARAFFPERAYVELKALPDPAADFEDRLMAEFRLDVGAAHAELGVGAGGARFVAVTVPEQEAAWIPPGACVNSIGYWHDPGARLLYREAGVLRSIGIASLISWHGAWYVVHLGGVVRPSTVGLVDDPSVGPGVPGPPGGC